MHCRLQLSTAIHLKVRPALSLAVGCCTNRMATHASCGKCKAQALQQAPAMCCRLHEGRAELLKHWQTQPPGPCMVTFSCSCVQVSSVVDLQG